MSKGLFFDIRASGIGEVRETLVHPNVLAEVFLLESTWGCELSKVEIQTDRKIKKRAKTNVYKQIHMYKYTHIYIIYVYMYAHIYRRTYIRGRCSALQVTRAWVASDHRVGHRNIKQEPMCQKAPRFPLSVLLGFYVKVPCYNRVPFKGSVRVPQVSG